MLVGQPFQVYYLAKKFISGKTNITLIVTKPDTTMEGIFIMNEYDPVNRAGHYVYEYTPTMEGNHLFTVFENGTWKHSKAEYCELQSLTQQPVIEFQ